MAKNPSPTFEFTRQYLEDRPDAAFAEIRDAAQKQGLKVIPVIYGRAKKALGMARPSGKTSAKKATTATVTGAGARRGRPPKTRVATANGTALDTLEGAIRTMRENSAEHESLRRALERIRDVANDALA